MYVRVDARPCMSHSSGICTQGQVVFLGEDVRQAQPA